MNLTTKRWPPDWWHHQRSLRRRRTGVLAALVPLLLATSLIPANAGEPEEKVAYEEITGILTYVGKGAISVEFSRSRDSSTEMLLPLSQDRLRLIRLQSVNELKQGDTVRVRYAQKYREDENGARFVLETAAEEITLVKSAPLQPVLSSRETPE